MVLNERIEYISDFYIRYVFNRIWCKMFLKSQFKLLFKNKEFILTLAGMFLLSVYVFISFCVSLYGADNVFVLSADKTFILRSESNQLSAVLPFLIPLVIVIPFADSYMVDKQNYILPSIMSQTTGKNYFFSKMFVVALSAGAVIFIPFVINMLLCLLAFPLESSNYSLYSLSGDQSIYYTYYMNDILFAEMFVKNPYLYNFIFLCFLTLFCMLCACLIYTISYFMKSNRILLLTLAFIVNNFIIIFSNTVSSIELSPFAYLIPLNNVKYKPMGFLAFLFAVIILFIILLSPICIKKLNNIVEGL